MGLRCFLLVLSLVPFSALASSDAGIDVKDKSSAESVVSESGDIAPEPLFAELPKAENVDLDKPISEADIVAPALDTLPPPSVGYPSTQKRIIVDEAATPVITNDQTPVQALESPVQALSDTIINTQKMDDNSSVSELVEWVEETTLEQAADQSELSAAAPVDGVPEADVIPPVEVKVKKPLVLLGTEVPPATTTRLAWAPHQSFEGIYSATPVLVVNGKKAGPTLCLTAAIHGDELNGIETVRRVLYDLDAESLSGAVIGVPIVNLQSFRRGSRYLSDRRDLNRFFPGDPNGSSASRIAYSFFNEVVKKCHAIVDLHTGSFYRTNLPQLRADLTNPKVVKMTQGFGSTVVLHSRGAQGTMRRAAVNIGIPTVTLEAGAPMVLDEESVSQSVKGIESLLSQLGMVSKFSLWGSPEPAYYTSSWQRAQVGGIIFSKVTLGSKVKIGDVLGTVTNPITNVRKEIVSQYNGRVLGMALNQVVQPGFAAYHIGIQAPEERISEPQEVTSVAQPESPVDVTTQLQAAKQDESELMGVQAADAHIESE